ncbi:extracellular solute-binding protein [Streptomyces sp. TS71-3]|uniref:extracellular solute-binding protein n=1 Tax=Streptomyces sp. TS71-3 TaxID=2733862 RepID=UPI001B14E7FF|nr:extracellular solute-binding protein [Streptomyces sp. TS71-3]GHJ37040.1 sugar ABC transporter substrate-binding protein [Streptomyces sp. TS71-3]
MGTQGMGRRRLLAGAVAAAAAGPLLTACSGTDSAGTSKAQGAANAAVRLPSYVPYQGVKPDLPGTAKGVLAGFYGYPAHPVTGVRGKPAAGPKISALVNIFEPVPPAAGRNPFWQELNKRLGTELDLGMVPDADYLQKLATVLAGGDLPDLVEIRMDQPQRAQILKAQFTDLTEYLSGDAVKKYPFLANIPTESWRACVYNGGIYALPTPRPVIGSVMFCRADLIKDKGLGGDPKSYAEFTELCTGLTDARNKQWALGFGAAGPLSTWAFLMQMLGAPNEWGQRGGRFTSWFETEEAKQAADDLRTLVKKGVFHPDSFAATSDPRVWFGTGRTALNRDGAAAWDLLANTYGVTVGGLVAPRYDGGGDARHYAGGATFALTALKKTSDAKRVGQLLSMANWLAAPLGTEEHLFRNYGIQGDDFTFAKGLPALTGRGKKDTTLPLEYLVDGPPFLGPGAPDRVRAQHDYQQRIVPGLLRGAGAGLYSDTDTTKKLQIQKLMQDALSQIMQGNKPVSAWDDAVRSWRTQGGDAIRAEYEAAYADAH